MTLSHPPLPATPLLFFLMIPATIHIRGGFFFHPHFPLLPKIKQLMTLSHPPLPATPLLFLLMIPATIHIRGGFLFRPHFPPLPKMTHLSPSHPLPASLMMTLSLLLPILSVLPHTLTSVPTVILFPIRQGPPILLLLASIPFLTMTHFFHCGIFHPGCLLCLMVYPTKKSFISVLPHTLTSVPTVILFPIRQGPPILLLLASIPFLTMTHFFHCGIFHPGCLLCLMVYPTKKSFLPPQLSISTPPTILLFG